MSSKPDAPALSMANTKKDMLEAYAELKKQLQLKQAELLDAKRLRGEQKREQTASAAEEAVATDPVTRIDDLKRALAAELDALAARFDAERERYRALCDEIENKRQDLRPDLRR